MAASNGGGIDFSSHDAYLRKFDSSGVLAGERTLLSELPEVYNAMAFDADGNVLVCGTSRQELGANAFGGDDAIVRAYSPTGDVLWTDQFGTSESDTCDAIAVSDGVIYILGTTRGALPGHVSAGYQDIFVKKYAH